MFLLVVNFSKYTSEFADVAIVAAHEQRCNLGPGDLRQLLL